MVPKKVVHTGSWPIGETCTSEAYESSGEGYEQLNNANKSKRYHVKERALGEAVYKALKTEDVAKVISIEDVQYNEVL